MESVDMIGWSGSQMGLCWAGSVFDPSGYGAASRGYVMALSEIMQQDSMVVHPKYFWTGHYHRLPTDVRQSMTRLAGNSVLGDYVSVQHLTPENYEVHLGACRLNVGMTTFETDSVPVPWQAKMRQMDEIWTFTQWGKQVFEDAGIRRPIRVINHGVDCERFSPDARPLKSIRGALSDSVYLFGASFDWTPRKNPSALLAAYFMAFDRQDSVGLVLNVYHQKDLKQSLSNCRRAIEHIKQLVGKGDRTPPVILLTDTLLPDDLVPGFYASLDAYVLPSCGEGWGLTFSEAMATGLPTIGVNWSGNTEFMNQKNSLLLEEFEMVDIEKQMGVPDLYVGHRWARCNLEELSSKMRWVYDHHGDQCVHDMRVRAHEDMKKRSWSSAAHQIRKIIEAV